MDIHFSLWSLKLLTFQTFGKCNFDLHFMIKKHLMILIKIERPIFCLFTNSGIYPCQNDAEKFQRSKLVCKLIQTNFANALPIQSVSMNFQSEMKFIDRKLETQLVAHETSRYV